MISSKFEGKQVDPNEAPNGFYALSKREIPERAGARRDENICHFCDWRKECNDDNVTKAIHNHRCMSYGLVVEATGEIVKRNDECSVIFKRKVA